MDESFHTLKGPTEGQYREKGSKFYAFATPVSSQKEAEAEIRALKEKHPEASHHCCAYRVGVDEGIQRENDDGEPGGTAGRPIMNAIRSYGITNVVLVVVRYFGGTKLGKRGLIDAYRSAAERALENGKIQEERVMGTVHVQHPHDATGRVEALIRKYEGEVKAAEYGEKVMLDLAFPLSKKDAFLEELKGVNGSSGRDPEQREEG